MLSSPRTTLLTSFGTSSLLFHPPNAVPFHCLPVTNQNGLVDISLPAAATPIMQLSPKPLCADSRAVLITATLPVQSQVQLIPHFSLAKSQSLESYSIGFMHSSAPNFFACSNFSVFTSIPQIFPAPCSLAA